MVKELQKTSRLNDELKRGKETKGKKGLGYKTKRGKKKGTKKAQSKKFNDKIKRGKKTPKKKTGDMIVEKKTLEDEMVEEVEEELIGLIESML